MFLQLTFLFLLFTTGDTAENKAAEIKGDWALVQTDLYNNGDLVGSNTSVKSTTHYHFDASIENGGTGQLTIAEDGEKSNYAYTFNANKRLLTLDGVSNYNIELLTTKKLVFYKEYSPHRSRYSFQKVE